MYVKKVKPTNWDRSDRFGLVLGKIYKLTWDKNYWAYTNKEVTVVLFDSNKQEWPDTHPEFIRQFEIVSRGHLNLPEWW
jgi:hypothetical protein